MKKVYFALALCCVVSTVFVVSCKKDEQNQSNYDDVKFIDRSTDVKILTFAELKSNVVFKENILNFKDDNDFDNVINFLTYAEKEEIRKWENTLEGFYSVQKYVDLAKAEYKLDSLNPNKFEELKAKYVGKVDFIDKGKRMKPMVDNGHVFGRIVGLNGQFRVGNDLVQYYKGNLINIIDYTEEKLNKAKQMLKDDPKNGIYLHAVKLKTSETNSSDLSQRGFTCTDGCPTEDYREARGFGQTGGGWEDEEFLLSQEFDAFDNTIARNNGTGSTTTFVRVFVDVEIEHRRSRWFGWSPTYGGFNWGFGWGIDLTLIINNTIRVPPFNSPTPSSAGHSAGGWSWFESSSDLNTTIPMWITEIQHPFGTNSGRVTCVRRAGLVSQSGYNPTGITNSQYCEQ